MRPLHELVGHARSLGAAEFVARAGPRDIVVAEPYEKGRDHTKPLFSGHGLYELIARQTGATVAVGREEGATVQLDHPAVSRLHVMLTLTDVGWVALDRSSNGTWLREARVAVGHTFIVGYGATLRLGRAAVLWLLTARQLWDLARQAPASPPRAPAPPAARPDRHATTAEFPAHVDDSVP